MRTPFSAVRAAARAMVFFLKVLPMLPSRPVDWVTPRVVVDRVRYPAGQEEAAGDVYRPAGRGRRPGIVVCLGVVPFGVEHPQVARLGEALARAGFAALLYWSPAMRDRSLDPGDAARLATAYDWFVTQPYVDPAQSGLLGTCVGGSAALLASGEPLIRERVAFVAAFAPYASLWSFARDVASATQIRTVEREPWDVDPLTREVFVRSVTAALPPDERELLRAASDGLAPLDEDTLSADARAVYHLLTAADAETAVAALTGLPAPWQEDLDALSPLERIGAIAAPLIVLGHDRDDGVIPVSESRQLRDALGGRAGVRYTEFALFQHATPRHLAVLPFARELVRFYRYAYPLFRATEP